MPSSTSSSNDRLPQGAWDKIWIITACLVVIFLTSWENFWRLQGFVPSLNDDVNLWVRTRAKVLPDNKQVIVLIGSSRMQLNVDTEVFAQQTGIAPVQLAIDGTTPLPILLDLAKDEHFIGTVICELVELSLVSKPQANRASEWVTAYHRSQFSLSDQLSYSLNLFVQSRFVFRLLELQPLQIWKEIRTGGYLPPPVYKVLRADRSRPSDYLLLNSYPNYSMVMHYKRRVARHYTVYQGLLPINREIFQNNVEIIRQAAIKIQQRGGQVIFVRFPTSGGVWDLDEKYMPRAEYWDKFAQQMPTKTIHFKDFPELQYELPDGSHLDYRQATPFTRSLINLLGNSLFRSEPYQNH